MNGDWARMMSVKAFTDAGRSVADSYFASIEELGKAMASMNPQLPALERPQECGVCAIPPPCWLPRCLGEVCSVVCPGNSASVRIQVTNCQPVPSTIQVGFPKSGLVGSVAPPAAQLGPMEREWFRASLPTPEGASPGQRYETLVWVLGCNAHYLRWGVKVAENGADSCHEVKVDDCPDYVHHWYDHFYCNRPCSHTRARTGGPVP